MASRSFLSPRSTVKAMTSQPWSFSQRIATEVSSPPEYASTTLSADICEQLLERLAGAGAAEDGDDRAITRDGAGDSWQRCLVDAACDPVGCARRRFDHSHPRYYFPREYALTSQRARAPRA